MTKASLEHGKQLIERARTSAFRKYQELKRENREMIESQTKEIERLRAEKEGKMRIMKELDQEIDALGLEECSLRAERLRLQTEWVVARAYLADDEFARSEVDFQKTMSRGAILTFGRGTAVGRQQTEGVNKS
jgi:hypothetical protein